MSLEKINPEAGMEAILNQQPAAEVGESALETPLADIVSRLLANETLDGKQIVDGFVGELLAGGDIANSSGDTNTPAETLANIDLAASLALRGGQEVWQNALSLFTRNQGLRQAVTMLGDDHRTATLMGDYHRHLIKTEDGHALTSTPPIENVDAGPDKPEVENLLAESSGEFGDRAVGVDEKPDTVGQRMAELTDGLSVEDRLNLRFYASAIEDKRAAQNKGAGEDSIYFGQAAGQHYSKLSPQAKKIAEKYTSLFISE